MLSSPQPEPIDVERLTQTIRTLITLEPDPAPVVSCYLDPRDLAPLADREGALIAVSEVRQRDALADAFTRIRSYLASEIAPTTTGVAIFARAGGAPMLVAIQFRVAVAPHIVAGEVADVYQLVELKDRYDRYIVFITSDRYSRILEVDLGAVTKEVWTKRPELRSRVRDKWSRDYYQRRKRTEGSLDEEFKLLDQLITNGRHAYLILAGAARHTMWVRNQLPPHLQQRVIEACEISSLADVDEVVATTLASFVATEQQESHDAVSELVLAIRRGGLAVAGTQHSIDALHRNRADLLVLSKSYPSGPAWQCSSCGWIDTLASRPAACSACDVVARLVAVERREALVRLAEQRGVEIELVADSDRLMSMGGVGCLLRYTDPPLNL